MSERVFVLIIPLFILLVVVVVSIISQLLLIETKQSIVITFKTNKANKTVQKHVINNECEWYHKQEWWSQYNITQTNTTYDPFVHISAAYNYSIPIKPIATKQFGKNPYCKYQGKIFNIGLQKTGTTTMIYALKKYGYNCFKYSESWIKSTCQYHEFTIPYPNKLRYPLSYWRAFSSDDITWAFANHSYFTDLFHISNVSQIFADSPWLFLYPLWDKLYPNSKYIYTIRASAYYRVNSVIKYHLMKRLHKKHKKKIDLELLFWNSDLENVLTEHKRLIELIMLMARLYEKHHENVLKYFGKNRIGQSIDKNVLILCLECEINPWIKISKFLGCNHIPNELFPHILAANEYLSNEYIPRNMSLDWRNYKFSKSVHDILDLIYDENINVTDKFYKIATNIWGYNS